MVTADRQERLLCKPDTDTLCQVTSTEGASAPSQLTEITMYKVRYKNDTLILTGEDVKYMFDATTTKLLELKRAIKDNNLDSLPRIAKFVRPTDKRVSWDFMWILSN